MTAATALTDYSGVLARLEKCRKSGRGWVACCPVHGDRHPSLYLWVGEDGSLRARCYAKNCPWKEIVLAVGTRPGDWFPEDGRREGKRMERKVVATYPYHDADGRLLYEVVRFDPKDFRRRRPDPDRPGQWLWNLDGVERVPYRLQDIVRTECAAVPVYVVEGEKDAQALRQLSLVATTNAGGAKSPWPLDWSRWFRGRDTVVIADNDPPGEQHAAVVAGALVWGGADSVTLVSLAGLVPDRGDVSDFLARFGGSGRRQWELQRLVLQAPCWRPGKLPATNMAAAAQAG